MASVQVSRQTLVEYQEVFSFFSQEARTEKEDAKITTEEFTTVRAAGLHLASARAGHAPPPSHEARRS